MKLSVRKIYLLHLPLILLWCSCNYVPDEKILLSATGKDGEILVVANTAQCFSLADTCLAFTYQGLPQIEPFFDISRVFAANFTSLLQQHRNILHIEISKNKTNNIKLEYNRWAKEQAVAQITATSVADYKNIMKQYGDSLCYFFEQAELKRLTERYKSIPAQHITDDLIKTHGIAITFPRGYSLDVKTDTFSWVSRETADMSQGILIYDKQGISNTSTINYDSITIWSNEILKKHVPVGSSGYMTTETEFANIQTTTTDINGKKIVVQRGLWRAEPRNVGMGGAFILYVLPDTKRNRIVFVNGYIYAPSNKKRDYIRQLQSIINTTVIM